VTFATPASGRELVAAYESVLEALNEALHEAQHKRAGPDEEIMRRESWIRQDREKAGATPFRHEAERYQSQADEHHRILTNLRAKMEPVEQSVNVFEDRLSAIEDQLLEP
jgi:heme oxygenase